MFKKFYINWSCFGPPKGSKTPKFSPFCLLFRTCAPDLSVFEFLDFEQVTEVQSAKKMYLQKVDFKVFPTRNYGAYSDIGKAFKTLFQDYLFLLLLCYALGMEFPPKSQCCTLSRGKFNNVCLASFRRLVRPQISFYLLKMSKKIFFFRYFVPWTLQGLKENSDIYYQPIGFQILYQVFLLLDD